MKLKNSSSYATVINNDGINYREIANTMSSIGFKMNHSSARNYVLRVMRKFATAILDDWDISVTEERLESIIKNPQFQQGICDVLQTIESENNNNKSSYSKKGSS